MTAIAIVNGKLADPAADMLQDATVLIEGDRIVATGQVDLPADVERIDAQGLVVAPGLVDLGVFATDKPAFHFGGITRAALMPDQRAPLDDTGLIRQATRAGKPDFWVHPIAAATRGLQGAEMAAPTRVQGPMHLRNGPHPAAGRRWVNGT